MPSISGVYNFFVSHLGFNSYPDVTGGVDVTRRQFVTGAAAAVTTAVFDSSQGAAQVFLAQAGDDGFRAGDAAQALYGNSPDRWAGIARDQGWNSQQVGQVQDYLSRIINADHGNAKHAISRFEQLQRHIVQSQDQIVRGQEAVEQASGAVGRLVDTVERDVDARALNAQTRAGRPPADASLDEASQQRLDSRHARLIEQTADPDKVRAAYMDAYGDQIRDNVGSGGRVTNDLAARKVRAANILDNPDEFSRMEQAAEQALAANPLSGSEQNYVDVRVGATLRKYDAAFREYEANPDMSVSDKKQLSYSNFFDQPDGRKMLERQIRLNATLAKSPEAKDAVYDIYRSPEPNASDVRMELDRFIANDIDGSQRLKALQDAGLEIDPSLRPQLDKLQAELAAGSETGREQLQEQGRDAALSEPLPQSTVELMQNGLARIRTVPQEQVLGELDARLSERFGEDTAGRYMQQIAPDYVRNGQRLEVPAAGTGASGQAEILQKALEGVQSDGYRAALSNAIEGGSIDRGQAIENIAEFRRELNGGMRELRAQGQAMQYQETRPKPQSEVVPEQPGAKPFMQDI